MSARLTAQRERTLWWARVKQSYPHHESLRGQPGRVVRDYGDGTVAVRFDEEPHKGDTVCMLKDYVELMS